MFTNCRSSVLVALAAFCVCLTAHGTETVELAPHAFTIPDGFELKRVAAPPLMQRPMHMYFDDQGVLYVTDSSGNTDKLPTGADGIHFSADGYLRLGKITASAVEEYYKKR